MTILSRFREEVFNRLDRVESVPYYFPNPLNGFKKDGIITKDMRQFGLLRPNVKTVAQVFLLCTLNRLCENPQLIKTLSKAQLEALVNVVGLSVEKSKQDTMRDRWNLESVKSTFASIKDILLPLTLSQGTLQTSHIPKGLEEFSIEDLKEMIKEIILYEKNFSDIDLLLKQRDSELGADTQSSMIGDAYIPPTKIQKPSKAK